MHPNGRGGVASSSTEPMTQAGTSGIGGGSARLGSVRIVDAPAPPTRSARRVGATRRHGVGRRGDL